MSARARRSRRSFRSRRNALRRARPRRAQTEGPFFRAGSPGRADLVEPGSKARQVELTGFVLTRGCNPVARAVVDLWHADERGAYDNKGFRYRGRTYTDEKGRYRFRTIVPALYPGRTRHYHVNVAAGGKLLLTTQLYFPDEPGNRRDGLFRKELLMQVAGKGGAKGSAKDSTWRRGSISSSICAM